MVPTQQSLYKEWTPKEDATLIRAIERGETYKDISESLGRTYNSVASRANFLRKRGKWKSDETAGQNGHTPPAPAVESASAVSLPDPEITAMVAVLGALSDLEPGARHRVLAWVEARFRESAG